MGGKKRGGRKGAPSGVPVEVREALREYGRATVVAWIKRCEKSLLEARDRRKEGRRGAVERVEAGDADAIRERALELMRKKDVY